MKKKKLISILTALCMIVTPLAASASEDEDAGIREKLVMTAAQFPKSTDITNRTSTDQGVFYQIAEMLFYRDGNSMVPWLADGSKGEFNGYDHEEGSTDYTVYLYDYITDSEGNNLTAEDVKFSYDTAYGKSGSGPWNYLDSVEAVDTYTVVFHCTEEMDKVGQLESMLANCFIFAQAAYEASPSEFATDVVATGPYILTSYVSGSDWIMERREDYWQTDELRTLPVQQANVQVVEFQYVEETAQQVLALETGDLDVVEKLNPSFADEFKEGGAYSDQYQVMEINDGTIQFLNRNAESEIGNNLDLIRAIYTAVDNENFVLATGGYYYPLKAFGYNIYEDYVSDWDEWENYVTISDQETVDEYLEAAGYNGEEVRFLINSGGEDMGAIIVNMLTEAGINVTMNSVDSAAYDEVYADPTQWDISWSQGAATDYLVNVWNAAISNKNTGTGLTANFVDDEDYEDLLQLCRTIDGHTAENMTDWWQYTLDNAYLYPIVMPTYDLVYSSEISEVYTNYKNYIIPGACVFAD